MIQVLSGVALGAVAIIYIAWSLGAIKLLKKNAEASFKVAVDSKTETLILTRELAIYRQLIGQPVDVRLTDESVCRIARATATEVVEAQKPRSMTN